MGQRGNDGRNSKMNRIERRWKYNIPKPMGFHKNGINRKFIYLEKKKNWGFLS